MLVLLTGTPGTESDWITFGLANRVIDNLIALKQIKPLLLLMPRADVLLKSGTRADNLKIFEPLLTQEILPHFQKRYRVSQDRMTRAIAGYSLGGELAVTVGMRHAGQIGSIGSFGGSIFERDFEDRFGSVWKDANAPGRKLRLLWIGCGDRDALLPGNQKLSEVLKQKEIQHVFRQPPGYHSMPTFRSMFVEFVKSLFR